MLKRLTALMLVMMLVLSMSTAFAWICPNCGMAMDNNYCTECGTKKPENICPGCGTNYGETVLNFCTECGTKMDGAAPTVVPTAEPTAVPTPVPTATPIPEPAISQVFENGNGTISILWDADGVTQYTIECVQRLSDDPWADRSASNGFYTSQGKQSTGFYTITRLIPGERYWIGLFDEDGRGRFVPFDPSEQPAAFSEFTLSADGKPMIEKNGEQVEAAPMTAKDIESGEQVGFYLALSYDNPGEAKEYITQIVIEAANGARWAMAGQINFKAATSGTTGWKFLNLTDYFARLKACFGAIFVGDYSLSVYVDGDFVGEIPFQVEKEIAATATPVPTAVPTPVPTAEPTATPTQVPEMTWLNLTTNANGTVTAAWDNGVPPYTVRYLEKRSEDYDADREDSTTFGRRVADNTVEDTAYTLMRLAPGRAYWISVVDANGNGRYIAYEPEAAEVLEGYSTSLEVIPRSMVGEVRTNLPSIPAYKAGVAGDVAYGMYAALSYDNPGADQDALLQLVMTLPNGAVRVVAYSDVTLKSGSSSLGWNFYDLASYWELVIDQFGAIPTGDVQVECYLDGKLAGSSVLRIRQEKPLKLSECDQQSNGDALLIWEDNGNAPYAVYYHERFSQDSEADRNDERSIGRWIAKEGLMENSLVIKTLIPGKDYWLTLEDSAGAKEVVAFSMAPAADSSLNMAVLAYPRKKAEGEVADVLKFSAAQMNQDDGTSYGLYIKLDYNALPEDVQKNSMWVITMPNGISFCESNISLNLFSSGSTYWDFYSLDWPISKMKGWYGEVLKGDYTFTLYVDGEYACSIPFTVGE